LGSGTDTGVVLRLLLKRVLAPFVLAAVTEHWKVPALATSEPVTQVLTATLGAGSLLVSVPEPCCCYADARYRQTQIVAMDRDASVVLVDWVTNGRAGLGENWRFASYTSDNRLFIGADLIARHKTELRAARDAADPTTPRSPAASVATAATMGATAVVGSILAFGPRAAPVAAKLRMMASGTSPASLDLLIAVSAAGTSGATTCAISPTSGDGSNGVLALRFCAVSADAARAFVREALADIHEDVIGRPLFGTA